MRLASELAGFSLGQADELRRAMGKKDAAKMQAQRDAFMSGCRANGHSGQEVEQDLRVHRVLCRLRLQQVAFHDVCAAGVSDRLSQGELSAALHGRAAHDRVAELRQDRPVPGRVPRAWRAGAAAGRQSQLARVHGGTRRRAVWPRRRQGRRRGRDPVGAGDTRGDGRPNRVAVRTRGTGRPAAHQQEGVRSADQGGCVRQPVKR